MKCGQQYFLISMVSNQGQGQGDEHFIACQALLQHAAPPAPAMAKMLPTKTIMYPSGHEDDTLLCNF